MLKRTAENALWLNRYRTRAEVLSRLMVLHYENLLDRPAHSAESRTVSTHAEIWAPCLMIASPDLHIEQEVLETYNAPRMLLASGNSDNSITELLKQTHLNLRCCQDYLGEELIEASYHLCLHGAQSLSTDTNLNASIGMLRGLGNEMMMINALIEHRMEHSHVYLFLKAGELIERCDQAIRLVQMAEDERFRDSPVLQLIAGSDTDGTNTTAAQVETNKGADTSVRTVRSAVGRERVRLLAYKTLGNRTMLDEAQIGAKVLPAPGSVDMHLVKTLIQNQAQPQSLAHCLHQLDQILSQLDSKQPAANTCRELFRRVVFTDMGRSDWSRDHLLDLLDTYQNNVADIHDQLYARYMRGPEVADIDTSNNRQASGHR